MGRYYWSKKEEADGLYKVTVAFLKKHRYLEAGSKYGTIIWTTRPSGHQSTATIQSFIGIEGSYIRLIYTKTNDEQTKLELNYTRALTTTHCHFGGVRYWFRCNCGHRVGTIYLVGDYFACRHCYKLTYHSRNLGGIEKIIGKITSLPELEKVELSLKRHYYAGKPTRKYRNLMKQQSKNDLQFMTMLDKYEDETS